MFSYQLLSAIYGATSITSFGAPSSLVQTLPYIAHIEHKHPTDPNLELEQIQVITRHGVRTPLSRYPSPYDKTEWNCDNLQEKIHDLLISRAGEPPVSYNQFEAEKSTNIFGQRLFLFNLLRVAKFTLIFFANFLLLELKLFLITEQYLHLVLLLKNIYANFYVK